MTADRRTMLAMFKARASTKAIAEACHCHAETVRRNRRAYYRQHKPKKSAAIPTHQPPAPLSAVHIPSLAELIKATKLTPRRVWVRAPPVVEQEHDYRVLLGSDD